MLHPSAPSTLRTPHGTAHIVIGSLASGKPPRCFELARDVPRRERTPEVAQERMF
jgi:hypothetical protein